MGSVTTKYLRAGGVVYVTIKMRNKNESPVMIKFDVSNPLKADWNNFAEILWKFAIHYLASEGMTETSGGTRAILVYVFHGQYVTTHKVRVKEKQVERPILHALHYNLTKNRSRFVPDVEKHFQMFFKLLDKHPAWEKFLDDMGEGEPPRAYLIAVEVAIRSYAFVPKAKMTMGIGPQKTVTRDVYANVLPWRKTECYITGVRFRRGRVTYNRWQDFDWSDHSERNLLAQTFIKRHLPLCDGEDHFGGELKEPLEWATTFSPPVKRPRRRNTKVKVEPGKEMTTAMKFDKTTGSLKPYVDLTV